MATKSEKPLAWWQLSLLGVACTIGTGFFLGSSIAINMAGPSVLIAYIIAAIGTYCVYEALSKLMINDPQKGAFRSYAKNAYGRWAGFSSGWVYWSSEMLIIGSQLTAISIFTQFWFPNVPLWVLASIYAALALFVILIGPKGFDRVENLLAILKAAAIVMFIVLAILALFGLFGRNDATITVPRTIASLFPNGITGLLPALIFGFYGFGGIEIMSLLAIRLKDMNDAPKSGKVMLVLLIVIYLLSLSFAMLMVKWNEIKVDESPFVTALNQYNIVYVQDIFNGVFIIAGFSTMVASLFAVIRILVTLAEDHDAPKLFAKKIKNKLELPAILLTTSGIIVSIILSIFMPDNIYEFVTTAAGLMLLYNWLFILASFGRILPLEGSEQIKRIVGCLLIIAAVIGTLFHHTSRPGFFISLLFLFVIAIITLIMSQKWKKKHSDDDTTLFKKL
ncbi:amino acid permease [Halalkalibacter hemicellulosilyticus]|uniref:Aromatic amino acid transporter n=1 Tax=Halalkalibacter hemicellulosilyticusJCM 9152 TaxID=1236971 RepID=W4QG31_9BACI|nr:amino acid permease [Halalkalibacter hemicellulosilyticus]GAE30608.1 aromatic amino acid transporter [Halalkalibacter hemicellulosilyticusJCM 9152]